MMNCGNSRQSRTCLYESVVILDIHTFLFSCRCYARLHPRAVNCRKKKCGHSNQVFVHTTF